MDVAPLMTWLLVSTSPDDVSTIPVPAAVPFWLPSVETTSTTAGSVLDTICDVVSAPAVDPPAVAAHAEPAPAATATAAVKASGAMRRRRGGRGGSPGYAAAPGPYGP